MSAVENIMNIAESQGSSNDGPSVGESVSSRTSSLMDMDYDTPEPTEEKTVEKEEKEDKASSTRNTDEEKEDKKEEKKEEKKKDSKKEEKEEEKEEKKEESEKRKIKYKVDGVEVEEEVDDQELVNNYSGRKALQKRFTQLDVEKKKFETEKKQLGERNTAIETYLNGNREKFEKIINDFSKTGKLQENPADGIFDMIDKMDLDVSKYDQALFFHYVPVIAEFLDMDDAQREAFLVKKENSWLHKKQQSLAAKEESNRQYRAKLEEENSAKRKAGLDEETFSALSEELASMLPKDQKVDVSKVIEWSQLKPIYTEARELVEKAGRGDAWKVTRILSEFPDTPREEILAALGYKETQKEKLKEELKDKLPSKPAIKKKAADMDEDELEFTNHFRR